MAQYIVGGVCVCVCGHYFQHTGHQPGVVGNPACSQLNRENGATCTLLHDKQLVGYDIIP